MSDQLNLGADHEQSKRLVEHWAKRFFNEQKKTELLQSLRSDEGVELRAAQARIAELTATLETLRAENNRLQTRDELFAQLNRQIEAYFGGEGLAKLQDGVGGLQARIAELEAKLNERQTKIDVLFRQHKTNRTRVAELEAALTEYCRDREIAHNFPGTGISYAAHYEKFKALLAESKGGQLGT